MGRQVRPGSIPGGGKISYIKRLIGSPLSWPARTFLGVQYTFDHLRPFPLALGGVRLHVKFGAHVFCKEHDPNDPADLMFMDGRTPRTFCPVRYGLSQNLGQTIVAASAGNVFEGAKGKFLFKRTLPAPQGTYVIAFQMWPNKSPHFDVTMQLNSAHARAHTARARHVAFADAVAAVANGAHVQWKKK